MAAAKRTPVDLQAWAVSMMERQNRKSHLLPVMSPSKTPMLRAGSQNGNDIPIGKLSLNGGAGS